MHSTILSAIVLIALTLPRLSGQAQSNSGDLLGSVLDPDGRFIEKARIDLSNPVRGYARSTVSDADGLFRLLLIPPGRYRLRVEAPGFAAKIVDGIEVRVGDSVSVSVRMVINPVTTEIAVQADAELIAHERTQQANTVGQEEIRNLPINRRNFLDFAILAPGVVETTSLVDDASYRPIGAPQSGLSFGGGNGRTNGVYIDGVENYNTSGGVRPVVTQEMAQEFQVNRNTFSAEFGNAIGGVINIITKSGTNDFHGNVFGFLRHREIQARNYFDPGKSPFTRVQAGGTLGGTIRKDRTFFFAGFERLDRQETNLVPILQDRSLFNRLTPGQQQLVDFFVQTGNPVLAGLAQQAQRSLIPGNNPALVAMFDANSGRFPFAEDLTMFSGRIDHRFSDRHSLFFRANLTKNRQENSAFGALDAYNRGRTVEQTDATAMLSDTYMLGQKWFLETRLMFSYNPYKIIPTDPNGPELNITGVGLFGRQIFLPYDGRERHYQVIQNFSRLQGRHTLKFGFDLNPVRNSFESATFFGGRFSFGQAIPLSTALVNLTGDATLPAMLNAYLTSAGQQRLIPNLSQPLTSLQAFHLGLPSIFQMGVGDPNYINFIKRLHFYVQDTWRVSNSLTLNAGVRYENEFHNPVVPPDRNNVAPRIGFSWSPGGSANTVIRGGYGLYYGQVITNIAGTADPLSGRLINQVFLPIAGVSDFINTQTGRPLTPADIYQTLLRQGVIGSRSIREADLTQFGVRVGPGLPLAVLFGVDKDFVNPWAHQASFEVEQAFGNYAVSVGYNFNRAAHLARVLSKNLRYTGERLPDGRPMFARIDPLVLQRNIFESSANSFYHAGIVQVSRRFQRGFTFHANYTFSKAMDESTDFNSDYSPNDQLNHRAERALSAFHQKHRFVLNAVYESQAKSALWKAWTVAPIVMANSWRPFNVLTGVDLPAGGDGYVTTKRPAHLGRNMGQGPDFFTFDLRLARRFGLGSEGRNLEVIGEGFNLFNRTNFRTVNNTVGDVPISALPSPIVANRMSATTPLAYTSALNSRQFQVGLKINF